MEFFERMSGLLGEGLSATIIIKNTAGGKMSVCASFNNKDGSLAESLIPFTLKGTAEEMDKGFLEEMNAPAEIAKGLSSNLEQFKKTATAAAKKTEQKAAEKPKADDAAEKRKREQERKEAEQKAAKENFQKAVDEAKKQNARGNYFTAEALLNLASSLSTDKKVKADITKQVKGLEANKNGFLCNDDEQQAKEFMEGFNKGLATAEDFLKKEDAAKEEKPAPKESTSAETPEDPENTQEQEEAPEEEADDSEQETEE